jgi:hypothetical protein
VYADGKRTRLAPQGYYYTGPLGLMGEYVVSRNEVTRTGVTAELAMEAPMACGFGACFGCVVPTRSGYIRLCVDGPVVDAGALETTLVPGAGH